MSAVRSHRASQSTSRVIILVLYTVITKHTIIETGFLLTFNTLSASSHTCIPRDSNTSTQPKYWKNKNKATRRKRKNISQIEYTSIVTSSLSDHRLIMTTGRTQNYYYSFALTLTWKKHVPARTSTSSVCHKWGFDASDMGSFLRRKLLRKLRRNLSIARGDVRFPWNR
jgi:hypothetical protein